MKKKPLLLLIIAATLLFPAFRAWRGNDNPTISFSEGESRFVIDTLTGGIVRLSESGIQIERLGPTAAGPEQPAPQQSAIVHYFLLGNGSISGLVWDDDNGSSLPDNGEGGMIGVRAYIDNDNSGTYTPGEPSAITDGNGLFSFPRVRTGTRNIAIDRDTLPSGYGFTTAHPVSVKLDRREKVSDTDIGVQNQTGVVKGTVWDQTDNIPITGLKVYLDQNRDAQFTPAEPYATTSPAGTYEIKGLGSGIYQVRVDNATLQTKYHRTPVNGANPAELFLASGGNVDASLTYLHKASISGVLRDNGGNSWANITLYLDLNNNGQYDVGEPLARTNESGFYLFDELYPGSYSVRIMEGQLPSGYEFLAAPGTIVLGEGQNSSADFLTRALPITISGYVWNDANGSGQRDQAERGLAGVSVYLDTNNNGLPDGGEVTAMTGAAGDFTIAGQPHGNVIIRIDDSVLGTEYVATSAPNPIQQEVLPGQTFDRAWFGYQRRLEPMHKLRYPTRLAWAGDGNLYVSDNIGNAVFILDADLKITGELKKLARPLGVAVDSEGNIYVGNQDRMNVEVYDPAGNLLRSLGNGSIGKPNDLAFDRDGNIYILDGANDTVLVYDKDGSYLTAIGNRTQINYGISIAVGYRLDTSGAEVAELYVADQKNCAIHVYDLNGTYKKAVGGCGNMYTTNWDGLFAGLIAVTTDRYGNIHGLDTSLHVTQVFEPQYGTFLRSYNSYLPENEAGLNLNTDLAINPTDDRVIVTNVATRGVEAVATVPAP